MKKNNTRLRIAQVSPLFEPIPPTSQNGLEFIISWLTEGLVKNNHDVTLFATQNSQTSARLSSLLPIHTNSDPGRFDRFMFSSWNDVMAVLRQDEFDIIHCHTRGSALVAPFCHIPLVQTLHHPYAHDILAPILANTMYTHTMKSVLDEYKKIHHVTVSKYQTDCFEKTGESYFHNYTCIPNGIPVADFSYSEIPGDYLLYIGYINRNKGADIAVQVARTLDMRLVLAGNNHHEEAFFKESIQPYLNNKITYVGPVGFEEKNRLYKNALAKLAPLRWDEPFGLTLAESLACGTPVIAFRKGAAPEIITHGETGFVVDTVDEMCQAVGQIKGIKRRACRERAEKFFGVDRMVQEYETLYYSLIKHT